MVGEQQLCLSPVGRPSLWLESLNWAHTTAMCGHSDTWLTHKHTATLSWAHFPVFLLPTETHTNNQDFYTLPLSQQSPSQQQNTSAGALLLLDVKLIFLPSFLSENTQVAGQGLCFIIKTVGLKILPAKLLEQLLWSDLRVNRQIFLFNMYDFTYLKFNLWKSLKRIKSSVDCSSALSYTADYSAGLFNKSIHRWHPLTQVGGFQ